MIEEVYTVQDLTEVDPSVSWKVLVIDPDGDPIVILR